MTTAPKRTDESKTKEVAELQATVEGVSSSQFLEYKGEKYKLADDVGHAPLMKFAHYSEAPPETSDLGALAALWDMLTDVIAADEWPRFEQAIMKHKAKVDDLFPIATDAIEKITSRPTQQP